MILIIWFIFIALMIVANWVIIEKEKSSPLHPLNAAICVAIAFVLLRYVGDPRPLWFMIPCLFITYWWTFDSGENGIRGLPIQHLGTKSLLDRLCKPKEAVAFWLKSIAFAGFTLSYCFNSLSDYFN
jgi:chromate transport protein ChrA